MTIAIMSAGLPALKVSTTPRAPHHLRSFISKEFSSCKLTNFSFTLTDSDPMLPTQATPKSVSPQKEYRRRARAVELETTEKEVQEVATQTVQVVQVEGRKKDVVQGFDSYDTM